MWVILPIRERRCQDIDQVSPTAWDHFFFCPSVFSSSEVLGKITSIRSERSPLGPVNTNPFSNENGAVLLRIRLSSTLQPWKRSPKTEPFENALQSGAIWKRCFLKTLFSSVDGENDAIWKRWRHQNHSTVSIQNGGQALPCSFNFAPISRADILKCACVEFIWPCALRV